MGRTTWAGVNQSLAAIGSLLKTETRLGDGTQVAVVDRVVEVRRKESLVVVTTAEELPDEPLQDYMQRLAEGRVGLLIVGQPDDGFIDRLPKRLIVALVDDHPSRDSLYLIVYGLLERVELRQVDERKARWLNRYRYELGELIEIARALSQERDLNRLLDLILGKSRLVAGADAGSIYVLEGPPENRQLRFKLSQNESIEFESREFTMPVSSRSIAGHTVVTRRPISIPDVREIPEDAPYQYDKSFDKRVGYQTRSMITIPLISAEDEVIGVVQLINKKTVPEKRLETPDDYDTFVTKFDSRSEELLLTLASQAGIALENALLYDEIKRIFEGFVVASVQAIESRDPTTSGHSARVSLYSCKLAEVVDRIDHGVYAGATFTRRDLKELEYAALLHDFGKIGVREQVLVKAKKLYPHELETVRSRIQYAMRVAEVEMLSRRNDLLALGAPADEVRALDQELLKRRGDLELAWKLVLDANEPTVLSEGDFTRIAQLGEVRFRDHTGQLVSLLQPAEISSLQVTRGSLNEQEIDEIRSHVVHTYDFLSRIPWGKSFSRIPVIAGAHHEKLDGTGYPHGIKDAEIPLPSKIMAVADIYDALTARDRPYKKAIPIDRALDILGYEVQGGKIDAELVRIFRESKVYEIVSPGAEP
jgi:HD-GYP domain-containing protein (c-di-GMP phosphodiesterase class II)